MERRRSLRGRGLLDVALVTAVALALKLPFLSHVLWAWDSVLYARGMDDFHLGRTVLEQRPQPPGYFLYILAARVARGLVDDPNAALVAISVASGALVAALAYVAARSIAGRRAGFIAAAVAIADPVLWEASDIAYPYALLALLAGCVSFALWRASSGSRRAWLLASCALALAIGARQDLALIVGPLWLAVAIRRGAREAALGAGVATVASLLWLVPTAFAAGGLDGYAALVWSQALGASGLETQPIASVERNAALTLVGLKWQLLWLWPLALAGALALARDPRLRAARGWLALSISPAVILYLALHIGETMYTLSIVVPLAVLVALGAEAIAASHPRLRTATFGATGALTLAVAATFLFGGGRYSAHEIAKHDAIIDEQVAYVRAHYPPAGTLVLARANYLHAIAYLPEYRTVHFLPANPRAMARLAQQVARERMVVFLDDSWRSVRGTAIVPLAGDIDLHVARGSNLSFLLVADDPVDASDGVD